MKLTTPFGLLAGLLVNAAVAGGSAAEPWTLERAIAHALASNPDARQAEQRVAAAQAGIELANAAFRPQVQFQSSYIRTDNPVSVFGSVLNQRSFGPRLDFNDVPDADNLNVKGVVTMPLYSGGRNVAGRDAARAGTEAARQTAEAVRNALEFEVSRTFFTIGKTREFIRASEAAVSGFEKNLALAKKRFNAGTILKAEVLDVEVRLAQAREELARARNAQALALRALRNLLGIDQGEFAVSEAIPSPAVPKGGDYSQRPELQAAAQGIRAAEAGVRQARGGYRPEVSAFGSLDHDYGWRFDGSGRSYTAGVMVQWNIWDGKRTDAKVRSARADLEFARETERKFRLAIDLEAEQARLNSQEAAERLKVTEKVIEQAAESVQLTRVRFEQGLALATQLIDAETALTAARVRRAEAGADQRIATAALRKALGLPQLTRN